MRLTPVGDAPRPRYPSRRLGRALRRAAAVASASAALLVAACDGGSSCPTRLSGDVAPVRVPGQVTVVEPPKPVEIPPSVVVVEPPKPPEPPVRTAGVRPPPRLGGEPPPAAL